MFLPMRQSSYSFLLAQPSAHASAFALGFVQSAPKMKRPELFIVICFTEAVFLVFITEMLVKIILSLICDSLPSV